MTNKVSYRALNPKIHRSIKNIRNTTLGNECKVLATNSGIDSPRLINAPPLRSGEVSVSCLRGHAVSFSNSTWQLLQHTTSAITTWAQELLTRAQWRGARLFPHLTNAARRTWSNTRHTLRPNATLLDTFWVGRTLSEKEKKKKKLSLLALATFFGTRFRLDWCPFFYRTFLWLLDAEPPPLFCLSALEFCTLQISNVTLTFRLKQWCNFLGTFVGDL